MKPKVPNEVVRNPFTSRRAQKKCSAHIIVIIIVHRVSLASLLYMRKECVGGGDERVRVFEIFDALWLTVSRSLLFVI